MLYLPVSPTVHQIQQGESAISCLKRCNVLVPAYPYRYPARDIRNFVCRGTENNGKMKPVDPIFSTLNVLNNKTIILLNFVEYPLILAHSADGLISQVSGDIPRDFAG